MTAAVLLGHWYLAAASAVCLVVILAVLSWIRERDERTKR